MTNRFVYEHSIYPADITAIHARSLLGQYDGKIRRAFSATRPQWLQTIAAIYATCATLRLPDDRQRWLESHGIISKSDGTPFIQVVKLLLEGASESIQKQAPTIADAIVVGFDQDIQVEDFYDFIDRAIGGIDGLRKVGKKPRKTSLMINQATAHNSTLALQ